MQSLQRKKDVSSIDDLINSVQQALNEASSTSSLKNFVTLKDIMMSIMK